MNPSDPNQPLAPTLPDVTPQPAPQVSTPPVPPPQNKSGQRLLLGIIVVVIVAAAGLGVYIWHHQTTRSNQSAAKAQTAQPQSTTTNSPGSVYESIQMKARDTKRQVDIRTLQTQLEAFFSQNGYYPSLTDMNSTAWRAANMKELDPNALADPLSPDTMVLVSAPIAKAYAYTVTNSSGAPCEADATTCTSYTLTATFESTDSSTKTDVLQNLD